MVTGGLSSAISYFSLPVQPGWLWNLLFQLRFGDNT